MKNDVPIFINVRDRVRELRKLVTWLEAAGHERIILLDNDSSWPPLLDYLDQTPHTVVRLRQNLGSRSIWVAGLAPNEPFIFTDPDIVPIDECPHDAVERLTWILKHYHQFAKAGLGLYLDDVSPKMNSLSWERSLVDKNREIAPGIFDSLVDTTFALHRVGVQHMLPGARTGFPYQCRHPSWYIETPDDEDTYYLANAIKGPLGSSWAQGHQRLAA